jgi:hypothetical protein
MINTLKRTYGIMVFFLSAGNIFHYLRLVDVTNELSVSEIKFDTKSNEL